MFHMFRNEKETEVDITSLNHILKIGKNLIDIGYFMAIICIVLLGTYLLKEWHILEYIGELLVVISPIFIGFLIAWLFDPLASFLEKKKIPRMLACILIYLIILGAFFLIAYLFIPSLASQVKDFVASAPAIFEEITNFMTRLLNRVGADSFFSIDTKDNIMKFITEWGLGIGSDMPKYLFSFGKNLISGGFNFILGLMIGFYLLYDFPKMNQTIYTFLPDSWKNTYKTLIHRINTSLRRYVQGVLLVMFLVFITQSIGLTLSGMKAPILFALFCAVTDIIPYFGPYIGGIPVIIVGFTISPITGICVIVSIVVVQMLENNFYQPLIMGHTMELHPVTIIVGLLIFGHFFGILGMVIATPCIACLKVILNFFLEKKGFTQLEMNEIEEEA